MPNRILKESVKTSTEIDQLSWFEECLFYRLMVSVDDYGCFDGRVIVIKNELFPTKENITTKGVADAIEKLERVKLLTRYEADGRPYIHLNTWEEHQRIRNKHRKYPVPALDSNLLTNDGQLTADCQLESEYESESESNKESRKKFVPPTLSEIEDYCRLRQNNVDPRRFYDYFSAGNWKDSKGNPVKNWKQKIITWENHASAKKEREEDLPVYDPSVNKAISDDDLDETLRLMGRLS